MAGSTITGLVTQTVELGGPGYPSPLLITPTGDVSPSQTGANAIYGAAGIKHARIDNEGQIRGGSGNGIVHSGAGIYMESRLTLTNSGTISGGGQYGSHLYAGGNGVDLLAGGNVSNTGMIAGGAGYTDFFLDGGPGGVGLILAAAGKIDNTGQIIGGAGGYGAHGGGIGGAGVQITAGDTLTNAGLVDGGAAGACGYDSPPAIGGTGVVLVAGGKLDNTTGTITGGNGQYGAGNGGTAVQMTGGIAINGGTIIGGNGGSGSNAAGGRGGVGVDVSGGGTLINAGEIAGGAGGTGHTYGGHAFAGVMLTGGTVIDSGRIDGGAGGDGGIYGSGGGGGVYIDGGTLIVSGTVAGGAGGIGGAGGHSHAPAGDAVRFGANGGTLVIDPGAIFDGAVSGSAGAGDALVLAAAATAGTLSGLGGAFADFGTVSVDAKADWVLAHASPMGASTALSIAGTLDVAGTVKDAGAVQVQRGGMLGVPGAGAMLLSGQTTLLGGSLEGSAQGTLVIGTTLPGAGAGAITLQGGASLSGFGNISGAPVMDGGVITASGGTLALGAAVSGSGTIAIAGGATLWAASSVSGVSVGFSVNAELRLAAPSSLTSTLSGFGAGDVIDLQHVKADGLSFAAGTLTVSEGATIVDQIAFSGSYTTADFALGSNHHGGTDISFAGGDFAGLLGLGLAERFYVTGDFAGGRGLTETFSQLASPVWGHVHSSQ